MNSTWQRGQNISEDLRNNRKDYNERKKEKEKRERERKERSKQIKERVPEPTKPKEFNLFDHPEMISDERSNTKDSRNTESTTMSYLDKCMIQKQIDKKVEPLKPGWIGIKNNKFTRDNVNYFSSIEQTYSLEEMEMIREKEEEEYVEHFKIALDTAYIRRQNESNMYYRLTGEKDIFAKERDNYELYEKYLEELAEKEVESSSDEEYYSDEDSVNSYD